MSQYFRVARLYEQSGDLDEAGRVLQLSLDRASDKTERHARLARLRAREGDWTVAAAEYRKAIEAGGELPNLLVALARVLRQAGDYLGSVDAYQLAIGRSDGQLGSELRVELARLHDQAGSWIHAASVLNESPPAYQREAHSLRLLAVVNEKLWRWNGNFEWRPDELTPSFVRLAALAGHRAPEVINAKGAQVAALKAMDRAIRANGNRPNWLTELGRFNADTGNHDEARKIFGRAHRIATKSVSRQVQASIHPAQFGLELANQRSGNGRASDPLFELRIEAAEGHDDHAADAAIGVFDVRAEHDGLKISGLLPRDGTERVEIWLDDLLLRRVNVSVGSFLSTFQFRVRRSALQFFPDRCKLTVRAEGGGSLLGRGRSRELLLTVPCGTGTLAEATSAGRMLDKKGVLAPSEEGLRAVQDDFLEIYTQVREFLEREFGKQLLLFYGNLLGFYRDGGFIPGDDDFDVGYVSHETDPANVKAEAVRVMSALMRAGYTVSVNRKGALFRVQRSDMDVHLSVRQAWFHEGKVWILRYANFPADRPDFLPPQEALLRGTKVLIPAKPEVFLAGHYGQGWQSPDPGFRYYAANVSPKALNYLHKARMSPAEFRALHKAMSGERKNNPAVGRLVALGDQSLYPIESYIE